MAVMVELEVPMLMEVEVVTVDQAMEVVLVVQVVLVVLLVPTFVVVMAVMAVTQRRSAMVAEVVLVELEVRLL